MSKGYPPKKLLKLVVAYEQQSDLQRIFFLSAAGFSISAWIKPKKLSSKLCVYLQKSRDVSVLDQPLPFFLGPLIACCRLDPKISTKNSLARSAECCFKTRNFCGYMRFRESLRKVHLRGNRFSRMTNKFMKSRKFKPGKISTFKITFVRELIDIIRFYLIFKTYKSICKFLQPEWK